MDKRIKYSELKNGMLLKALGGHACLHEGKTYMVYKDRLGEFRVTCEVGDHMLDGQIDQEGYLTGFERVVERYEATGQFGEIHFTVWWEGNGGENIGVQDVLDRSRDAIHFFGKTGFIPLTGDPKDSLAEINKLALKGERS